jgi:hypothetical protein
MVVLHFLLILYLHFIFVKWLKKHLSQVHLQWKNILQPKKIIINNIMIA